MKILGVESSATSASVSVVENGKVIALESSNTGLTHSQTLMPMVESILKKSDVTINDIDYIAVSNGPGSFTGIRIGISGIKGLAAPENKPCFEVSTLESIAENFRGFDCTLCAVMDARCNQVYNGIFKIQKGEITRITEDRAVLVSQVEKELEEIDGKIFIAGDGAKLFETFAQENQQVTIAKEPLRFQNAVGTALVAERLCKASKGVSHLELKPLYLRLPQAERELKEKKK
jgi:tRNA threonylcarbamoyladenosine biosynthesis protein TsaB